jgi:hypothetical protein
MRAIIAIILILAIFWIIGIYFAILPKRALRLLKRFNDSYINWVEESKGKDNRTVRFYYYWLPKFNKPWMEKAAIIYIRILGILFFIISSGMLIFLICAKWFQV